MTQTDEKNELLPYAEAAHAMQTGVKFMIEAGSTECSPKHLRVGINVAMSDQAGLVQLLIEKGVFTQDEYCEAITRSMNAELQRYEKEVNDHYKSDGRIKLR